MEKLYRLLLLFIISFGLISCGSSSGGDKAKENIAPMAIAQEITVINDQTDKRIILSGTDKDGNKLTYSIVEQPKHGVATVTDSVVNYRPAIGYSGEDSFEFTVNDGRVDSLSATVTIEVEESTPGRAAAWAKIKAYAESSDVEPSVQDYIDVGASGVTAENISRVNRLVKSKTSIEIDSLVELTALISIVNNSSENHAPVANSQVVSVSESSTDHPITLVGTDSDGDTLTYSIETQPLHGRVTLNGSVVKYTPNTGYSGADSFEFKVSDGKKESELATVTIMVVKKVIPSTGKPWDHGKLEVSTDKRMLQHEDGTAFFWMADTAWFAPARMTREEIDKYLTDRAEKGFTVVQINIMSLVWLRNAYGDFPYPVVWEDDVKDENGTIIRYRDNSEAFKIDQFKIVEGHTVPTEDFNRTLLEQNASGDYYLSYEQRKAYAKKFEDDEYDYWDHVEYIVDKAEEKGIYIAMVVSWGGHVEEFIKEDRDVYTKYIKNLTDLFKDKPNLIWLNGGDVYKPNLVGKPQWDWIGEAIKAEDPNHLLSFHGVSSSATHHTKSWLDFNMIESGHGVTIAAQNQKLMVDYDKTPVKPVVDGETRYEEMTPVSTDVVLDEDGRINAKEVREIEYYQLFSGAFGVTYGHNSIWQVSWQEDMDRTGEEGYAVRIHPLRTWEEALNSSGAYQMQYLSALMQSRPILGRVPDQSLIVSGAATAKGTRGDGYAMVYSTSGETVDIALGKISGTNVNIWSFNPRTGEAKSLATAHSNSGSYTFTPEDNEDWVIVIDDDSKGYGRPGQ